MGEFIDQPQVRFAEAPGALRARVDHFTNTHHRTGDVRYLARGRCGKDRHS
jgi:hypothetical protein